MAKFASCLEQPEIIEMTGRTVNAGVIHAVLFTLLKKRNICLVVNWQMINQNDQNVLCLWKTVLIVLRNATVKGV